jgi:hypothetical protein
MDGVDATETTPLVVVLLPAEGEAAVPPHEGTRVAHASASPLKAFFLFSASAMACAVPASTAFTLLGFCVSVLFIVWVCSRLACAVVRRRRARRRPLALPHYAFPAARQPAAGLDPAAVAAFPTRAFAGDADAAQ